MDRNNFNNDNSNRNNTGSSLNSSDKNEDKQPIPKTAVALRYDMEKDDAPKVIASGKGSLADKILAKAEELDIPIKKDQDLVTILAKLNIGEEIPPELYQVMAEILSFIYRLENR